MKKIILITLLSIFYVAAISEFLSVYKADKSYAKSQRLLANGDYVEALVKANEAAGLNPFEPIYFRGRAKILLAVVASVPEENKAELKKLALHDLNTSYNLNPRNLATIRNIVPLYSYLATEDLSKPAGADNVDREYLPVTLEFYKKVKNISPNDVGIYVLMAKYEKRLGLVDEYNVSVEKVRLLRPDLLEWHENFK